jgi:hypothetical protein
MREFRTSGSVGGRGGLPPGLPDNGRSPLKYTNRVGGNAQVCHVRWMTRGGEKSLAGDAEGSAWPRAAPRLSLR